MDGKDVVREPALHAVMTDQEYRAVVREEVEEREVYLRRLFGWSRREVGEVVSVQRRT